MAGPAGGGLKTYPLRHVVDLGGASPALVGRRPPVPRRRRGLVDGVQVGVLQMRFFFSHERKWKFKQSELNPLAGATENEEHNLVELVPAPLGQRITVPPAGSGPAGAGGPARGRGRRVVQRHRQRGGDADVVVQVQRRGDEVAAAEAGADLPGRPAGPGAAVPALGGRAGHCRGVPAHHAAVGLRDALPELRVHVPAQRAAAAREPRQRWRLRSDAAGARVARADLDQRVPMVVVVRLRLRVRHDGAVLPQQLHELAVRAAVRSTRTGEGQVRESNGTLGTKHKKANGKQLRLHERVQRLVARRRPLAAVHGEQPLPGPGGAQIPDAHTGSP